MIPEPSDYNAMLRFNNGMARLFQDVLNAMHQPVEPVQDSLVEEINVIGVKNAEVPE